MARHRDDTAIATKSKAEDEDEGCNWGFSNDVMTNDHLQAGSDADKFIAAYEEYLRNNKSAPGSTPNESVYSQNAQKSLEEWFVNEGHKFEPTVVQQEDEFICHIELPLEDQDFEIHSEAKTKRKDAILDVCLKACKLLDSANILYPWQQTKDPDGKLKRKQLAESQFEDDCEYDDTAETQVKQARKMQKREDGHSNKVDTYDSLMTKWRTIMMSLSKAKAQLVTIDLSVKASEKKNAPDSHLEDEDPLDTYMNTLSQKPKLSINDKIQKSKLKNQISQLEKEKAGLERLIELAKPACSLKKASSESLPVESRKNNQQCSIETKTNVRTIGPTMPPNN